MGSMAVTTSILSFETRQRIESDKLRHCRGKAQGKLLFAERHVRIICIGAGASGLCFAYKLQRSFRNFTLNIYEKNEDLSGTWFENRYPGSVYSQVVVNVFGVLPWLMFLSLDRCA